MSCLFHFLLRSIISNIFYTGSRKPAPQYFVLSSLLIINHTLNQIIIVQRHDDSDPVPPLIAVVLERYVLFPRPNTWSYICIHRAISKERVIIIGKSQHPEVLGTVGWTKDSIVIENENDITKLNNLSNEKLYLVCQTTFNISKADELIEKIRTTAKQNNCELIVNKSICSAQKVINDFSYKLAKESDIMIVVGGKKSSNSLELFNNVSRVCPSIFIEDIHTYKDALKDKNLSITSTTKVGITAGASTMKDELFELKTLIENDIK